MKLKKDIVKILSLAFGLAIGAVLVAKVCFELQYDSFFANKEQVYKIITGCIINGGEPGSANQISGAVAPGFKEHVPGVKAATRVTPVFNNQNYYTEEKNKLNAHLLLADTSLFDIFTREIYVGDPHKIFNEWGKLMVSYSFAQKLGGIDAAVGQTLYNESLPQAKFTIEGVYQDFPHNSSLGKVDILLSLPTYSKSSTDNWVGNDRYHGFVRLQEGVDPASLADAIQLMQEKNQPLEDLEKEGYKIWYYLERADSQNMKNSTNRNMVMMLSIVALLLIAVSLVNYILNALSSVVKRAKEIGVRKCYGAGSSNIFALLFKEAAFHLSISLIIAAVIVLAMKGVIEPLLDAPLSSLFTPVTIMAVLTIFAVILLVAGYVPARIFRRIPVSVAFRSYKESKRKWKLLFLAVQFTFTIFLVSVMALFARQYDMLLKDDLGYEYDNLLIAYMPGTPADEFFMLRDKIDELPQVTASALVTELPMMGSSGNNVYLPGVEMKTTFNIADQYYATEGTAELLGIKFIEGREARTPREIAVSRKFVESMQSYADWSDGAIGKSVILTEHSQDKKDIFTICGVYEDYKIGALVADERPSARFSAVPGQPELQICYLIVKLSKVTPGNIAKIEEVIANTLPDRSANVDLYENGMIEQLSSIKKIKDAILLGVLFSLVISIMGLIGYIKDETQRRSAEMAIRKINGAQPCEIIRLFIIDVLKLLIVAVIVGDLMAYITGDYALQMFRQKAAVGLWPYLLGDMVVALTILVAVVVSSLKISNSNPVDSLKNE